LRAAGVIVLLALALALAAAGRDALARLLPAQVALLGLLMPEFHLESASLVTGDEQLRVAVRAVTVDHVVLRATVHRPGIVFEARTPARQTSRRLAVLAALAALVVLRGTRLRTRNWILFAVGGIAFSLMTVPVVLAGQMWSLVVAAASEPSARALLVWSSDFLLHGGDLALAAIALMVLSDHAPASSGHIANDP
jgi:hypothetical protein